MARQPVQIHVYLYREKDGRNEYAIFQRADDTFCWQGISGGLEDGETEEQAARRELFEETGISAPLPLYKLDSISSMPADTFRAGRDGTWGKDIIVVPMFYYAMPFDGEVVLSEEHADMQWLPYEKAHEKVYYLSQKHALYELNERLKRGNLIR